MISLSNDKNRGLRPRFLSTESPGPWFSHGMGNHDQILQQNMLVIITIYVRTKRGKETDNERYKRSPLWVGGNMLFLLFDQGV